MLVLEPSVLPFFYLHVSRTMSRMLDMPSSTDASTEASSPSALALGSKSATDPCVPK